MLLSYRRQNVKKLIFFLIICFVFFPVAAFAQEAQDASVQAGEGEVEEGDEFAEDGEEEFAEPPASRRFKDRTFEVGLAKTTFSLSNDYLSFGEIFTDRMVIDIDKLSSGLNMGIKIGVVPLYFNYVSEDGWGFGLSLFNTEVTGNISLSGDMLSFKEAVNSRSDVNAAVFTEIVPSGFFQIQDFKIRVKSSFYYPLVYVVPNISYTYQSGSAGTKLDLLYGTRVYTGFSTVDGNEGTLTTSLGVSLSAGADYPLSKVLGLTEISRFLDFDVALDFINIPLVPATMKSYMETGGRISADSGAGSSLEDFFDSFGSDDGDSGSYDDANKNVFKAFKMIASAKWRPLMGNDLITIIPMLGFCIDPLYEDSGSLEIGVKARLDLYNFFIAVAGLCYTDRTFVNSLDLTLNLRAFELNIGGSLQSQGFVKSWTGGGFGLNFGLKFGW
jgi:hypothetical protein